MLNLRYYKFLSLIFMYLIIGLGNPGEEYEDSRHNTGRRITETLRVKNKFPEWRVDSKSKALISSGKIGKEKIFLALPETFMNKSGEAVKKLLSNVKCQVSNIVIVYDDLDLPLGKMKISFNRGSGGHRGLLSIEKNLKTREFIRLRVGITPSTKSGKLLKPQSEREVIDFILGKFSAKGGSASGGKKPELEKFKKISGQAVSAIQSIVSDGLQKAMGEWN